jgi:hypothetical protein
MKRSKICRSVFVVTILGLVCTTTVLGRIIPVTQQAKDNAHPELHTDVITVVEENWVLELPENSNPPIVPANGKTIPASDNAKDNEHATPYEHSPAINPGWTLTVPPNITGVDNFMVVAPFEIGNTLLEPLGGIQNDITRQFEVPFESSTITLVPEPSMLILLGLGAFLARRRC